MGDVVEVDLRAAVIRELNPHALVLPDPRSWHHAPMTFPPVLPVPPGMTILTRTTSAIEAVLPIDNHPMWVSVDETDLAGHTWRVAHPVQTFTDSRQDGKRTVTVVFRDGTPDQTYEPDDEIDVHTFEVRVP
jgi:hypothetical protein